MNYDYINIKTAIIVFSFVDGGGLLFLSFGVWQVAYHTVGLAELFPPKTAAC